MALAVAAFLAPTAAFHLLPPQVTGETDRLAEVLQLVSGSTVADIGAGSGEYASAVAKVVGPSGKVYATELSDASREEIRRRVSRERLSNVTVVEAGEVETGLPDACCDAIFLRNVYHHIGDPDRFNPNLYRAARPGARLAIIDFEPSAFLHLVSRPQSASQRRSGHGVNRTAVIQELERVGFRRVEEVEQWGGRTYMVLFRKPE